MESINISNPCLRNGPSCRRFQSTVQISINWAFRNSQLLPIAEVLTLQAYSPGINHNYVIDITSADIKRSFLNRKFIVTTDARVFKIFCNTLEDANVWAAILTHSSSRRFSDYYRPGKEIADGRHSRVYGAHAMDDPTTRFVVKVNSRTAERESVLDRSQFERDAHLQLIQEFNVQRETREKKIDLEERKYQQLKHNLFLKKIVPLRDSFGTPAEDFLVFFHQSGQLLSKAISRNGPLNERDARIVMWDLLTAIHFMHEQGIVH